MKFQFWSRPVQCSGSPARSDSCAIRWNQRWPPWSRGRLSHAQGSGWRRPSGNRTRYCCSGSAPKVSLTGKSATVPPGPSVWIRKRSPSRRKVALWRPSLTLRSEKSPSTFAAVAAPMARAWSLSRQAAVCAAWQPAQVVVPTKPARALSRATTGAPPGSRAASRSGRAMAPARYRPTSTPRAGAVGPRLWSRITPCCPCLRQAAIRPCRHPSRPAWPEGGQRYRPDVGEASRKARRPWSAPTKAIGRPGRQTGCAGDVAGRSAISLRPPGDDPRASTRPAAARAQRAFPRPARAACRPLRRRSRHA
jgi:hypothetical protein